MKGTLGAPTPQQEKLVSLIFKRRRMPIVRGGERLSCERERELKGDHIKRERERAKG